MKKLIVLTLFGLLIVSFSTTGYAQKLEFKASGFIDAQTYWGENVPVRNTSATIFQVTHKDFAFTKVPLPPNLKDKALDKSFAYMDSRARLKFDAIMGKDLSGTIYFEIDAARWGDSPGGNLTRASERNTVGVWSTDRAAVEVKNVYIDVGLPYFGIPVPVTVRIGAQPIGVRPQMFLYTDGAGIMGGIRIDPVTIIPMWGKILEGSDWASDDADMYGLHVNAKIGSFVIGGYGLYYNMNTYPLFYPTGVNFTSLTGSTSTFTGSSSYGPIINGTQQADIWWFGAYADGKAGPVNINFDFVYDYGDVKQKQVTYGVYTPKVKYQGWATRGKIDFPWEKFNFGVVGMYASGADANKTSTKGLSGDPVANPAAAPALSSKVGSYVVPPGSEHDTNNNESVVFHGTDIGASGGIGVAKNANYYQMCRGGFGGTWFAKLYASVKLTPWYKATLQGLYIGDTTKNGNTLGTAVKPGTTTLRDDNDIGFELDLINELEIYKNLKLTFGGGYLWAGDALDIKRGTLNANYSPKNPWAVRTRLMYTF